VLDVPLSGEEQLELLHSAEALKKVLDSLDLEG